MRGVRGREIPEDVLWTLRKDERTAEARKPSNGQPELRLYIRQDPKAKFDLLMSQVLKDDRAARTLARDKKTEFETQGWVEAP